MWATTAQHRPIGVTFNSGLTGVSGNAVKSRRDRRENQKSHCVELG